MESFEVTPPATCVSQGTATARWCEDEQLRDNIQRHSGWFNVVNHERENHFISIMQVTQRTERRQPERICYVAKRKRITLARRWGRIIWNRKRWGEIFIRLNSEWVEKKYNWRRKYLGNCYEWDRQGKHMKLKRMLNWTVMKRCPGAEQFKCLEPERVVHSSE